MNKTSEEISCSFSDIFRGVPGNHAQSCIRQETPQHFTYGVVSEEVFAEILRESSRNFEKYVLLSQKRVRKFFGKLRKFRGNLSAMTPSRTSP